MALVEAFESLGYLFLDYSGELVDLDESVVMPSEVVENVRKVELIGHERYKIFLDKRIHYQEKAFTGPIAQIKLQFFKAYQAHPHK